jgi:hypothetical protein
VAEAGGQDVGQLAAYNAYLARLAERSAAMRDRAWESNEATKR